MPEWLRTVRLAPGPPVAPPSGRRRLWTISVVCAVLALGLLGVFRQSTARDPDRLVHSGFAVKADGICAAARRQVRSIDTNGDEVARTDAILAALDPMVARLGAVLPSGEDEGRVERWLGAWDRYLALGRDRRDALAGGHRDQADAANLDSRVPKAAIDHFAGVNGMVDCLF